MDAENLKFPDSSFDVVFCGIGLVAFPDKVQALRERMLFQTHTLEALLKEIEFHDVQVIQKDIDFWYKDAQELLEYMLTSGETNIFLNSFSELSRNEIKKELLLKFQALTTDKGILSISHPGRN
jgi:ubiquinone/menaquinone biosynthesis C-methylase UbiE